MRRRLFALSLLLWMGACVPPKPPIPPVPQPPEFLQVTTVPAGAMLRNDLTPSAYQPNPVFVGDQGARFPLTRTDFNICATLFGYREQCVGVGNIPLVGNTRTVSIALEKTPPPSAPTHAELIRYRGNFCNLLDSQGRVIFDPFIASLSATERQDWYQKHRDAGSTHLVLSPRYSYNSATPYPIAGRDMLADPQAFRQIVLEATQQPAADGKGFRVAIFLDDGAPRPRDRIDRYWQPIIDALADLNPYLLWVPGWELIKASDWTSADYSYALGQLHAWLPASSEIWGHLSTGRASWSSNPVEPTDPWQGAESDAWKTHNGQYVTGFLYQTTPLRDGDNFDCAVTDDNCYLNRWADVVPRLGTGMNGWRVVPLVAFEGQAYHFFQRQLSAANVTRMANAMQRVCVAYGVVCGFGNGLPR